MQCKETKQRHTKLLVIKLIDTNHSLREASGKCMHRANTVFFILMVLSLVGDGVYFSLKLLPTEWSKLTVLRSRCSKNLHFLRASCYQH